VVLNSLTLSLALPPTNNSSSSNASERICF
jgi:hypothetical protein